MEIVIGLVLYVLAAYFGIGLLFGIFFLFAAPRVDPHMTTTPKGVRFLLFPGTVATWPFLLRNVIRGQHE